MMRITCFIISALFLFSTCYASDIPDDPNRILPPHPLTPKTSTLTPLSGTDSATTSYPAGNMDTVQIQSLGTSGNNRPQSHPIPLDKLPLQSPNDIPAQ